MKYNPTQLQMSGILFALVHRKYIKDLNWETVLFEEEKNLVILNLMAATH